MLTDQSKQDRLEMKEILLECVEIGLRSYARTGNEATLAYCESILDWAEQLSTTPT